MIRKMFKGVFVANMLSIGVHTCLNYVKEVTEDDIKSLCFDVIRRSGSDVKFIYGSPRTVLVPSGAVAVYAPAHHIIYWLADLETTKLTASLNHMTVLQFVDVVMSHEVGHALTEGIRSYSSAESMTKEVRMRLELEAWKKGRCITKYPVRYELFNVANYVSQQFFIF